jgi:hypothetical protein
MANNTKACNLTEDEIKRLIAYHGYSIDSKDNNINDETALNERMERLNYLHKRLKSFKEPDADVKSDPKAASGWGAPSNG